MSMILMRGVVLAWDREEGWGVITSPELPDRQGAWAHFSSIQAEGYRALLPGQPVDFACRQADQDGYRYVAEFIRPA